MLALLLVAVSVGLSNFAASVSLGVAGVDARTRLRIALVFGVFEAGMPVVGLLIGARVASVAGDAGRWIGGALLIAVGVYAIVSSLRAPPAQSAQSAQSATDAAGHAAATLAGGNVRLLLSGLALSLDNLVVGFALGAYRISILLGAIVIGAVSVTLSLIGLELGARLGTWAGRRGDQLGGLILVAVGAAVATGALA
jgi:manganese efflux pump family protein